MSRYLAFFVTALVIAWFFKQDKRQHQSVSNACWIPLLWLFILGSRPLSGWPIAASFGISAPEGDAGSYMEGSPFDRIVFLSLIVSGLFILIKRKNVKFSEIVSNNKFLVVFFLYLGLSAFWSDFTAVSFKRWIKELGNVVMALVILSESDPIEAARSVLLRATYALVLLSVLFIKYFPEIGRYYSPWTWTYHYGGATQDKNMLGMSLFFSCVALVWGLMEMRKKKENKKLIYATIAVLISALWLFHMANSSTALGCTVLGGAILVGLRQPKIPNMVRKGMTGFVAVLLGLVLLDSVVNLKLMIAEGLGRDLTLTGRTEIWKGVLSEKINPVLGTGFYSFWLGDRAERLSENLWFHLNESHNGYLETYLNSGWVGLLLLALVLLHGFNKIRQNLALGDNFSSFRLAIFSGTLIYNITEAVFNRLSPVWFLFLLVIIELPGFKKGAAATKSSRFAHENSPFCSTTHEPV